MKKAVYKLHGASPIFGPAADIVLGVAKVSTGVRQILGKFRKAWQLNECRNQVMLALFDPKPLSVQSCILVSLFVLEKGEGCPELLCLSVSLCCLPGGEEDCQHCPMDQDQKGAGPDCEAYQRTKTWWWWRRWWWWWCSWPSTSYSSGLHWLPALLWSCTHKSKDNHTKSWRATNKEKQK